MSFYHLC